MPGRPPKPVAVLQFEQKSHRTKAELEARKKAEQQLLTGVPLKAWPEVRENKLAYKEFQRLKKLLATIKHNDGLYEAVINRYCLLLAECKQIEQTIEQLRAEVSELKEMKASGEIDAEGYLAEKGKIQGRMLGWDKALMTKRKMLLSIESQNIMTILSALRSVPKTEQTQKESPMAELLRRKREQASG